MRTAAKVDANQPQIVAAFRALGCVVFPTHQMGKGFPDLAVRCGKIMCLVEIKDGAKPPSAQKLTPQEQAFHDAWAHHGLVEVVRSTDDVLRLVKQWRAQ
jgi:hypothetical protein